MRNVIITSLHEFIKNFSKDGVSNVPNENILFLNQKLEYVCGHLAESNTLPCNTSVHVLTGFTQCSVSDLIGPFELINNTEKVRQVEFDGATSNNKRTPERMGKITLVEKKSYTLWMWPIPGTFPEAINIALLQSSLSLVMNRIASNQRRYLKPLMEALVAMARNSNARMNVASGSATRKNLMEGIIMKTIITLEIVFKIW